MTDPITIGVASIIAIGSAVGGYMASPKKRNGNENKICPMHSGVTERLDAGDNNFKIILSELRDHGEILARLDERTEHLKAR